MIGIDDNLRGLRCRWLFQSLDLQQHMRGCELLRCRVEIDIVGQTGVGPGVGSSVPLIAVTRGGINGDPATVYIALVPPVVKLGDVGLRRPVVVFCAVETDMVSVDDSRRDALRSRQCADCCRVADTGRCNLAVLTVGTVFLISHIVEIAVRVDVLSGSGGECDIVVVEVFCDVFVNLQQLFVVCACALDDLIRNGLEVFDLLLGDRGDFFAHRIAEANRLDIAEIGLFESGSLFLLVSVLVDAGVFLDDLIILQDRELAVRDAERAVLVDDRIVSCTDFFGNLQNYSYRS